MAPDIASEPTHPEVVPHQTEPSVPATAPLQATQDETISSRSTSDSVTSIGDPGTFLSGDGLQGAIDNIVDMGFPRDQVLRAMRASFNNADRAVEYLTTVSDFTAFPGYFNLIYYFSRDSQHIPNLMLLRQLSALRFKRKLQL